MNKKEPLIMRIMDTQVFTAGILFVFLLLLFAIAIYGINAEKVADERIAIAVAEAKRLQSEEYAEREKTVSEREKAVAENIEILHRVTERMIEQQGDE